MTIDFDYTKAMGQANQVDEIANDLRTLANTQLQYSLDTLSQVWRGEASKLFIALYNHTKSDIITQANHLQNLAATIRKMSKIIKDAEEQAKLAQSQNVQK